MTTKKQEVRNVPNLRFPGFEGEWEERKLGEVSDVRDGTHDSPKYHETGYPFITSKNLLKNGSIDFENVTFINKMDYDKFNGRSKVEINDILFGMIGTIGNPVLVKSNGFAIKNVALIKQKDELLNIFLIHFLKGDSINQQFFEQNTGGTQKFLSLSIIRNLSVIVPSLSEQTQIASFLSLVDERIQYQSKIIGDCEETTYLSNKNWEFIDWDFIKFFKEGSETEPIEKWNNTVYTSEDKVLFEFEIKEVGLTYQLGFEKYDENWKLTLYFVNVC